MRDKTFSLLVLVSVALLLLSSFATSVVIYKSFTNGHRFRVAQAKVWHDVLCAIEAETDATPGTTQEAKEKAHLFYDRLLALARADPCPVTSS